MSTLQELIKNEQHEKILELESVSDTHKCIALIKLKKYTNALKYCEPISYEAAYILYSLKKYKQALKLVNQLDNSLDKVKTLKSQILYYLGRYNEAYTFLRECNITDEHVVNLTAMKSLAELAHSTLKQIGTKFTVNKKDEMTKFKDFEGNKFEDKELEEEYFYNDSFRLLSDEKKYVDYLKHLSLKYHGIIQDQLNNVLGNFESINEETLSKSKKVTLSFNKNEAIDLKNKTHFQKGIIKKNDKYWPNNEYYCFKTAQERNYNIQSEIIPSDSNNLKLLNAFINLKRMFNNEKFTRKYFNHAGGTFLWEIVQILSLKESEFKKESIKIRELLKKIIN
ncbi:hypothetical protein H312_00145, partial [Anncaliia algerae PRA339]